MYSQLDAATLRLAILDRRVIELTEAIKVLQLRQRRMSDGSADWAAIGCDIAAHRQALGLALAEQATARAAHRGLLHQLGFVPMLLDAPPRAQDAGFRWRAGAAA